MKNNKLRLQKIINETYEEEAALINVDTSEIIIKGDYYHNKISEYIDGIFHGLHYVNVSYERLPDQFVTPDMDLFKMCKFYEETEYN
ncbi:MAG TPA: hypothetical protein GXZ90_01200 [Clostridiales bacterium]|nr:hypothetical protein [Clostridiales bacterium]